MSQRASNERQSHRVLADVTRTTLSIVVSASQVTDIRATLLQAAHQAGEAALRAVKPGAKNWEVTDAIKKVLAEYEASGVKGVEGVLSHQVRCAWAQIRAQEPEPWLRSPARSLSKIPSRPRRALSLHRQCNSAPTRTTLSCLRRVKFTVSTFSSPTVTRW